MPPLRERASEFLLALHPDQLTSLYFPGSHEPEIEGQHLMLYVRPQSHAQALLLLLGWQTEEFVCKSAHLSPNTKRKQNPDA